MKKTLITLSGAIMLIAVLGRFYAKPVMAAAVALVQNIDEPARAPFQVTVNINRSSPYTTVSIPSGKRLVVDYVSYSGAAQTSGPFIQPIVLLYSTVAAGAVSDYYFSPNPSVTSPGQYNSSQVTKIFADSLSVGEGFSGYDPTFLSFSVVISGHLITP